nr:GNAT family N-acetyltransferase [Deinobacterium chartae]
MIVERFQTGADFARVALPLLLRDEAANNLMVGLSVAFLEGRTHTAPSYAAVVRRDGEVIAAALRTWVHLLLSTGEDPAAFERLAEDAFGALPELPSVNAPRDAAWTFARRWARSSGHPPALRMAQRIYRLERVIPARAVSGRFRAAHEADRARLLEWVRAFAREALEAVTPEQAARTVDGHLEAGTLWVWEDAGEVVCMTGTPGRTPHGVRVNLVYTPPGLRGRGYASALVAAVSQHMLDSGCRYTFLYTDLSNPTSNAIYRRLGYQEVCDVDEIVLR